MSNTWKQNSDKDEYEENNVTLTIKVDPPNSTSNFLLYNNLCTNLDSDYLMQPVNEALYDSETQACVDKYSGGPSSYYDHFVSKPRLKRGVAVALEVPLNQIQAFDQNECLQVPSNTDMPITYVDKDVLNDPVTRRIATGRLPPKDV